MNKYRWPEYNYVSLREDGKYMAEVQNRLGIGARLIFKTSEKARKWAEKTAKKLDITISCNMYI
jgi:hypothetical protein